jgi:hypothetical protein
MQDQQDQLVFSPGDAPAPDLSGDKKITMTIIQTQDGSRVLHIQGAVCGTLQITHQSCMCTLITRRNSGKVFAGVFDTPEEMKRKVKSFIEEALGETSTGTLEDIFKLE